MSLIVHFRVSVDIQAIFAHRQEQKELAAYVATIHLEVSIEISMCFLGVSREYLFGEIGKYRYPQIFS